MNNAKKLDEVTASPSRAGGGYLWIVMKLWMRSTTKLMSVLVTLRNCDSTQRVSRNRKRGSIAAGLERNRMKVSVSKAGRYCLRISKSMTRSLLRCRTASLLMEYIIDPLNIPRSGIVSGIG